MKLPLNKKMIMLAGIGILVAGLGVVGMKFMKKRKMPPAEQAQAVSPHEEGGDGADIDSSGTATAKSGKPGTKVQKESITPNLPPTYKQHATTIFKPLSSNEIAKLLKELEAEKAEYQKKKEMLDFREKVQDALCADLETERKELDALKQELNKILDSITTQKVELKKGSVQFDETESKNLKRLATVYGGMKPEKAAMIIKEMDEDTAVKLLTMMDGKSSGRILESFEPNLAVKLSEKLKLLKTDFKSGKK